MALREGNRRQLQMLPPSIEQYISEDAPVRVYDLFVDSLDLDLMGIRVEPLKEGNPAFHAQTLSLWLFLRGTQFQEAGKRNLL